MAGSWAAFASTGDPSSGIEGSVLQTWPSAYDDTTRAASPLEAKLRIIGGPLDGATVLENSSTGDGVLAKEKILERCLFINGLNSELMV